MLGVGSGRKSSLPTGSDDYKLSPKQQLESDAVRERCLVPFGALYVIITDCKLQRAQQVLFNDVK